MPQRHFHFRPPPGVPQSENVTPLSLEPPEPTELLKQLGLEDDDPFGESPGNVERVDPAPRMRISAAAAAAASSATQHGGDSAKSNPFWTRSRSRTGILTHTASLTT
jgi:hypothetical protein